MDFEKIRLFAEYWEERKKFDNAAPNNMELFKSVVEKAECLKFLVDSLRFFELTLFEVKKDNGLRRSDRSYAFWVEEQRNKFFEGNTIKVLTSLGQFIINQRFLDVKF